MALAQDRTRAHGTRTALPSEPAEMVELGVAHVELEPGEPTETAGHGQLQVNDETGKRAPADQLATGEGQA